MAVTDNFSNLAIALGVGLLVGAERERRKQAGRASAAGIRTFTVASLAGAASFIIGGVAMLSVVAATTGLLAALGYWRTRDADPGITSEVSLVATVVLGALSIEQPVLAGGIGATIAILLAARTPLHRFVGSVVTEAEVADGLLFAAASLIVFPLLPNRAAGPFTALNPHAIWLVVLLVLAISSGGHITIRLIGARYGLAIAGFASGFVSSVATIGAMGARAKRSPELMGAASSGAVLSTVATIAQMSAILWVTSPQTLYAMTAPLAFAGTAAVLYGVATMIGARLGKAVDDTPRGHMFSLPGALIFSLLLAAVVMAASALRSWLGDTGAYVAAAVAGLADAHAAAASMASMAASGQITPAQAVTPILLGLSSNTLVKVIASIVSGGSSFSLRVVPGLLVVQAAAWLGAIITLN